MAQPGSDGTARQLMALSTSSSSAVGSQQRRGQTPLLPGRDMSLSPGCPFSQHSADSGSWSHKDEHKEQDTQALIPFPYPSRVPRVWQGLPHCLLWGGGCGQWGCEPCACSAGSESPTGHCWLDSRCGWQAAKTSTRVRPRNIKRLLSIRSFPKRHCNRFRLHLTDFSLFLLQCLPTGLS